MNPLKLLDVNAFLAALRALSGAFAVYRVAIYPPPRPTERVAAFAEQPAAAEDETVVRVKLETLTRKDAERLNGKLVVATFVVGMGPYTLGAGKKLTTVTVPTEAIAPFTGAQDHGRRNAVASARVEAITDTVVPHRSTFFLYPAS